MCCCLLLSLQIASAAPMSLLLLKQIKTAAQATLNDVFVAAFTGAVRRCVTQLLAAAVAAAVAAAAAVFAAAVRPFLLFLRL